MDIEQEIVKWCRNRVNEMSNGDIWFVPRARLTLMRTNKDCLCLLARLSDLSEDQRNELDMMADYMEMAGIEIAVLEEEAVHN